MTADDPGHRLGGHPLLRDRVVTGAGPNAIRHEVSRLVERLLGPAGADG